MKKAFDQKAFRVSKSLFNEVVYDGTTQETLTEDSNKVTSSSEAKILEDSDGFVEINIYAQSPDESDISLND